MDKKKKKIPTRIKEGIAVISLKTYRMTITLKHLRSGRHRDLCLTPRGLHEIIQSGRYKGQREADVTDVWGTVGYQLPQVFDFSEKTLYEHAMRRISTSRINCETLPTTILKHVNQHHQTYGVGVIKGSLYFEMVCKKHQGTPKTHCRQCRARNEAWHMAMMVAGDRHISKGLLVRRAWIPREIRGDPRAVTDHSEWIIDIARRQNFVNARPLLTIRKLPLDNGILEKPTDVKRPTLVRDQATLDTEEPDPEELTGGELNVESCSSLTRLKDNSHQGALRPASTRASRLQKERERIVALMARPGDTVSRRWGPRQAGEAAAMSITPRVTVSVKTKDFNLNDNNSKPQCEDKTWKEEVRGNPNPKVIGWWEGAHSHPDIKVARTTNCAITPTRSTPQSAGLDLYSARHCIVPAQGRRVVTTDLVVAMPEGSYGRIAPKSGLAVKHFLDVGAGVIDADYRGVLNIVLFNFGRNDYEVKQGQAVAQLITERIWIPEVVEVEENELEPTERGNRGFGSTKDKNN